MAQRNNRVNTEYVLSSLNDDSDGEDEETDVQSGRASMEPETYEEKTMKEIQVIKAEVEKFEQQINSLESAEKNKHSKFAEYLLQTIIKLDNIDTKNNEIIREARKGAIIYAQHCLQILDAKSNSVMNNGLDNGEN